VVITASLSLADIPATARLWRQRKAEFALSIAAFLGVALLGVLPGIAIAVGLSILNVFRRAWWPYDTELGRAEGLEGYHDVHTHPDAQHLPGLVIYRFDAPLFFANATTFRDEVRRLARADRDLAQWAGVGLADARLGLARCGAIQRADRLAELPSNPQRAAAALPPPRLLGAFEPLLLGWASRDPIVGAHRRIVTAGGLFRPFALAGGRAVATWNIAGGQVVLAPFAPLDTQTQAALAADAADVMRFLGQ
jgi:hypothetical protein